VLEVYNGTAWIEAAPQNIDATTITSGTIDIGRIGSIPVGNIDANALNAGELLIVDGSYNVVGVPSNQILHGYNDNASVGTTFSTAVTDVVLTGSSEYSLTMTAHIVEAVAAATTVTMRMTIGASNLDYQCYIASGQTGVISATRYFSSDPSTSTDLKHQLKLSTGSGIRIITSTTVIGIN
jgi:hypothetical protein